MKKRVLTLIAAVIAIILCSALFIACSNADPNEEQSKNPEHKHSYTTTVIDPTCTEQGYTLHKCTCKDEYKDTYVNVLGHNYVNGVCSRCNKQEGVDPVDPDHEHSYTATVIDPTCTEQGYTLHKCSCDDEYKDTYTNALNHSFTNYISDNNATCIKNCTETAQCDNGCGETDTRDIQNSKTTHTDNGNGVCSDCGQTIVYSEGLRFLLNDKESYYVNGIGNCTDTEISIPAFYNGLPVTSIGNSAFYNCTGLTSITIPNSVTSIGSSAFYNTAYYNNESNWENDVLYIGKHLIVAKSSISGEYTIKAGTKTIACSAFSGCTGLTSITIPDSVTSIGMYAFEYCTGLTSVTIGNSVTSIGNYAFSNCTGLTSISVGSGNTKYHSAGNCIIETQSRTLIVGCKSSVIPTDGSVTSISYGAFYGCTGLTSITIPNSVTDVGNWAFSDCTGLTSMTIPDSITSIGWGTFEYCTGLTSVSI